MITKEMIDRINELAKKAKTEEGLTQEETEERDFLRRAYIDAFKKNLRAQLENIKFVDRDENILKDAEDALEETEKLIKGMENRDKLS